MVEEQKQKRRFSNKELIRRLSGNLKLMDEGPGREDGLNVSFPDHFGMMKVEDNINEKRPT